METREAAGDVYPAPEIGAVGEKVGDDAERGYVEHPHLGCAALTLANDTAFVAVEETAGDRDAAATATPPVKPGLPNWKSCRTLWSSPLNSLIACPPPAPAPVTITEPLPNWPLATGDPTGERRRIGKECGAGRQTRREEAPDLRNPAGAGGVDDVECECLILNSQDLTCHQARQTKTLHHQFPLECGGPNARGAGARENTATVAAVHAPLSPRPVFQCAARKAMGAAAGG